jgi:formate dehydrogenase subunit gamma
MAVLHGGPAFVWLAPIHKWSTYALVPLILGHVVIASGVLPGYRSVWRSMHLGGPAPGRRGAEAVAGMDRRAGARHRPGGGRWPVRWSRK